MRRTSSHVCGLLAPRRQLGDADAAARVLRALAELGQAQEDVAGERLLLGRERVVVDRLRRLRDRPAHAARLQVAEQRQHAVAATPPRLEQAVREQRQRARLTDDVVEIAFDQAGFEHEAGVLGGPLDRPPQLLLAHRPDERLAILERRGEAR